MDWMVFAQNFGFNAVCVVALALAMWKIWERMTSQNEKREDRYLKTIDNFQEALSGFKEVLIKYDTKLSVIEEDVKDIKDTINK